MDSKDLIGFGLSFMGMAFGFGRQSGEIRHLRRDTDNIGNGHRQILDELSEIKQQLARLEQRIAFCEKS